MVTFGHWALPLAVTKSRTLPAPVDLLGVRGRWPVSVEGYRVEGSTRRSDLSRRWLVPVTEDHRFVYLDEERRLGGAVADLAKVAGRTYATTAEEGARLRQ